MQQSKLSRMENGLQHISDVDLGALLAIYQVHGEERRQLLRLAQRQDAPGYWVLDPPLKTGPFVRMEREATSLVDAENLLMPGLVQTAEYMHAMMKAGNVPSDLAELKVNERMLRKETLTRANPPKFEMIVDEGALRRIIGSPAVMARQLRAMLELADRPNVRLSVVPFKLGGKVGFHYPFFIFNFQRDQSVVFLESKESAVYLEDDMKIDTFRRHAARLVSAALNPAASMDLVATIAREYERE